MDLLWAWTVVSSPLYLFLKKSSWQHVCWLLPLLYKTSVLLLKILTTQCKTFALSKSAEILLQFQWIENIFEANKYSDIYMYLLSWHWKLCKTFCISSPSPTHSVLRMSVDYAGTISLPFPCFLLFLTSDFFFYTWCWLQNNIVWTFNIQKNSCGCLWWSCTFPYTGVQRSVNEMVLNGRLNQKCYWSWTHLYTEVCKALIYFPLQWSDFT